VKPLPIRVRLTGWYLAVICLTFVLSSLGMYLGMLSAIQHTVDRALSARVEEMRQFLWRHRRVSQSDLPEHFRQSSEIQPGEELFQVADSSGAWVYQAPMMEPLRLTCVEQRDHEHSQRTSSRSPDEDRETDDKSQPCGPGALPDPNRTPQYVDISRRDLNVRLLSSTVEVSGRYYLVQVATVLTPLYEVLSGFGEVALFTLPFVLLAAGTGGYWLSGRAMKPVHDITSTAHGISEQNLSQRLEVPAANDELRQLSETLNEMLARLDAAFTKITRFTADASHELRTPIATIRTTAEVILERHRSVEEYEEMVRQILAESEFTSELIENLLTLARADANPAQLELSSVDARSVMQEIAPGIEIRVSHLGLEWSVSIPSEEILVLAERQSLKRLLLILVDNAIKYTPRGGTLRLALRSTATQAVFEVMDSGVGVMPEDLPHIFERFYRASNARYLNAGGSGLGLAIAQWIAVAHHGTLEALSPSGQGTIFRLTLPLQVVSSTGRTL
jgi:heavy metal sensor kinase